MHILCYASICFPFPYVFYKDEMGTLASSQTGGAEKDGKWPDRVSHSRC
jgi:hypothetical protein